MSRVLTLRFRGGPRDGDSITCGAGVGLTSGHRLEFCRDEPFDLLDVARDRQQEVHVYVYDAMLGDVVSMKYEGVEPSQHHHRGRRQK